MTHLDGHLNAALTDLAAQRPVFHSEADFQLALAWRHHELMPAAEIRLERRMPTTPRVELDVFIRTGRERFGIELKFPRATLSAQIGEELFDLRTGAADVEGYSVVKDVWRLERLVDEGLIDAGYVVVLTNNHLVWSARGEREFLWDAFRLTHGTALGGVLSYRASEKTWPGQPIELRGTYPVLWADYSIVREGLSAGTFRRLLIHVA